MCVDDLTGVEGCFGGITLMGGSLFTSHFGPRYQCGPAWALSRVITETAETASFENQLILVTQMFFFNVFVCQTYPPTNLWVFKCLNIGFRRIGRLTYMSHSLCLHDMHGFF